MKTLPIKRSGKQERERAVLLSLVEHYIKTGKPVGSNTLKEVGFADLSSATIRNYFAHLEDEGYLSQPHISGGRLPTHAAYRLYADEYVNSAPSDREASPFKKIRSHESREIATFLHESVETLSQLTGCAAFLSAPRFDHDFIVDIKLVQIDAARCLCVIVTDFGLIQTEVIPLPKKFSAFAIKRLEAYFHWRITGLNAPENLGAEETAFAQGIYNELMVRYIVGYSNFIDEDIYRTGFSNLLKYPDFQDTAHLASSLSLFENAHHMRVLLRGCVATDQLKFWIGDDLVPYSSAPPNCAVLTIPYHINHSPVGAVGLLGPTRIPYRTLFQTLRHFSESVSEALTRNIYKFKISFRQPETGHPYLQKEERLLIEQASPMLLEDRRT